MSLWAVGCVGVALGATLVGCGDPASEPGVDGGIDARVDAPPGCTRPALDAPWLSAYLTTTVGQLAAAPRATSTQRATARGYLSTQLAMLGLTAQAQAFNNGSNLVATIPATMGGSAPEILVGAHFDTVSGSPGANDNASGSAVVLAIARYLTETPCRTAPVTVVWFDLEEAGLFGSRAFALTRTPAQVRAVHTIDQVAWDADDDRGFEVELPTATLAAEYRAAAQIVGVPMITTTTTQGTDHEAFRERGFAAAGLTEQYVGGDTSPYRHLPGDTPATVDAVYLALAAQLAAQVILDEVAP